MAKTPDRPDIIEAWDTTKESNTEAWEQKRRLAAAMRLVMERLVPSNAPEDELRRAAEGLERYAEALTEHPRLKNIHGHPESATSGDVGAFFDQSPFIGLANPLAPPIRMGKIGDQKAGATVIFGSAYEGAPGCVHGGYVAGAFDEVLGYVNALSGQGGMTGRLTIHYRSPTPLHTELYFEGEILRIEGRKIFTEGKLYAGERLCAEAEGLFISVGMAKFQELLAQREAIEKERDA